MRKGSYLFTSESVTEGHPDKIADQISDAVLDAILERDSLGRVACETFLTTGFAIVGGEISTECYVEVPDIVRRVIREIGYTSAEYGFDHETCGVVTAIQKQSPDIAIGVDTGGAGDQGMMFGYACNETPELMPMPIMLAHKLCRALAQARKDQKLKYLRPDGKSQVTVEYNDGKPVRVDKVLMAAQHDPTVPHDTIYNDVVEKVVKPTLGDGLLDDSTKYLVNPTGKFSTGGPQADTGLTGRKIIVDTYGGTARHGGGCFSGKDPTKVDRSASYMMRYIAKNIVAAKLATHCEVQVAYAIGERNPLSVNVETFGTGASSDDKLRALVTRYFDLTPLGMIQKLDLRRPIYRQVAAYGHFGRTDLDVPWEKTDFAGILAEQAA